MVSIPGSIGKAEGLAEYLSEWQNDCSQADPTSSQRKRKIDQQHSSTSGQVIFPITFPQIDDRSTLEALISKLDHTHGRDLVIEWNYVKTAPDMTLASMQVYYHNHLILENEYVAQDFMEFACEEIESLVELFVAIVFAAHNALLSVTNLKLKSVDNDRSLNLEFDLHLHVDIAKLHNAVPLISAISRMVHSKKIVVDNDQPPLKKSKATEPITPPMSSKNTPSDTYTSYPAPAIPPDISLEGFFTNLQPPISTQYLEQYVSHKLTATLTPFQSQNIEWMVHREGHTVTEEGKIIKSPQLSHSLPLLYSGYHENELTGKYINLFRDVVTTNREEMEQLTHRSFKGGILADEMGLGKTVSVLGLISKHIWNAQDNTHPKSSNFLHLTFSKGTLIIAPGSIMSQWASEAKRHAPALRVYEYNGAAKDPITAEELAQYDLVLVYYETFKNEISHSKPPPDRPRRQAVKYGFKMSPLVQIFWFRCILDEAQMVETTTTKAANMVKRIPRWYSWAVTGTPMKRDFNDLFGLYNFLELDVTVSTQPLHFRKFNTDLQHKGLFFDFTRRTMRRNMKKLLKDQIHIPKQSRHVVLVPFSTIEQHYYEDLWRDCKMDLRLDWMDSIDWKLPRNSSEGVQDTYRTIKQKMRPWLLALRQNCIHPSLITNPNLKLGNQVSNTLAANRKIQSLTEVLDSMAKEARDNYDNNQHAYFVLRLKHGGMFEILKAWDDAIGIYTDSIPKVETLVQFHAEEVQTVANNNKRRVLDDEDEEERTNSLSVVIGNYHRWNLLLHQFYFYLAGVYHTINSEEHEVLYYKKAADIRRLLLEKQTQKVNASLQELNQAGERVKASENNQIGEREFDENLLKYKVYLDDRGQVEYGEKKERDIDLNMLANLKQIGIVLDRQYAKILYLRKKTLDILMKKLIDNDDQEDATGEEYDNSLSEQEMVQVYIASYEALLQDRKFIVKGIVASLTEMAQVNENGEYISDEAKKVEAVEKNFRKNLREPGFQVECLKDVEFFLKTLKNSMRRHDTKPEYKILVENHDWLKSQMPIQSKLVDDLDLDVRKLNQLFNSRISYYKSLQVISDTLLEWKHSNPNGQIAKLITAEEKLEEVISNNRSRDMYFKALAEEQKNIDRAEEVQKDCLMCREPIEKGMITYCGHTSCMECGLVWFKESRRCHTCNSKVKPNEWYNVSYKTAEIRDKDTTQDAGRGGIEGNQLTLNNKLVTRINAQNIVEGQGGKLDGIIRHIKFIKNSTNGKCVVFSQWARALDMLKSGLTANQIKYITLSAGANKKSVAKFQEDPDINVMLLDARSQSSGLTLVCAQTVFIMEPVFNESLEKQAINRIHRIGQTKETSVFWYIVQDTIEERIQAIHDEKRRDKKSTVDDTLQLSNRAEGGGEMVGDEDLRRCFTTNQVFAPVEINPEMDII